MPLVGEGNQKNNFVFSSPCSEKVSGAHLAFGLVSRGRNVLI
jgi:hypothetical protein